MAKISLYKNFRRPDILRTFINAKIFTTKVFVHEHFQIYGIYIRYMYICFALFRNLRFLQKALRFLGIPRTLALALTQVGATISTVPQWATVDVAAPTWARARMGKVEMAAPTWARARMSTVEMVAPTWVRARARMGTVEMVAPTWVRARVRAKARAGPHPACVRARARSGRRCAF